MATLDCVENRAIGLDFIDVFANQHRGHDQAVGKTLDMDVPVMILSPPSRYHGEIRDSRPHDEAAQQFYRVRSLAVLSK
jgi:hypothetical protein